MAENEEVLDNSTEKELEEQPESRGSNGGNSGNAGGGAGNNEGNSASNSGGSNRGSGGNSQSTMDNKVAGNGDKKSDVGNDSKSSKKSAKKEKKAADKKSKKKKSLFRRKKSGGFGAIASRTANRAGSAVSKGMSAGQSGINSSIGGGGSGKLEDTAQELSNYTKDGAKDSAQGVKDAVNTVEDTIQGVKNTKKNFQNAKKLFNKAKNLVKKAKNKVSSMKAKRKAARGDKAFTKGTSKAGQLGQKMGSAAKNTPQLAEKAAKVVRKVTEVVVKVAKAVAKAVAKVAKAAAKALFEALKAIGKAIVEVIIFLVSNPIGWIILAVILVIVLVIVVVSVWPENSKTGDIVWDSDDPGERNEVIVDEEGEMVQVDWSTGNKVVSAYYTYFSTKSVWILLDGYTYDCRNETATVDKNINSKLPKETITINGTKYTVCKPIQYGSKKFIDIFGYDPITGYGMDVDGAVLIKDKYDRESDFYLSYEAIAELDKILHEQEFRYPESIIQKVKYKVVIDDPATGAYHFELDDLADDTGIFSEDVYDDEGNLIHKATLSTAYTQNENETMANFSSLNSNGLWIPYIDEDNKVTQYVPGVWDYGFGSILHYAKYLEGRENRGKVVSFQVLDKSKWNLTNESDTKYQEEDITVSINKYLSSYTIPIKLYKKGTIVNYTYTEWEEIIASGGNTDGHLWTGDGNKNYDPTATGFDKNKTYILDSSTSYMIDWVVTPAGTIYNKIDVEWQDTGEIFSCIANDGINDFNTTDTTKKYTNETTIDVVYIEESNSKDGMAIFAGWPANYDLANNKFTKDITAEVHLLRLSNLNNDADNQALWDAYKAYVFTENGAEYIGATRGKNTIYMFNPATGLCNKCGKTPNVEETTYSAADHSGCTTIEIPCLIQLANGDIEHSYIEYKVSFGDFKVSTSSGSVTKNPSVEAPMGAIYNAETGAISYLSKTKETLYSI